ncbi:MAG: hypothetical protein WC404_00020 [Candidatus Omnitrophota bacterium]|jgi:hypothetical protein
MKKTLSIFLILTFLSSPGYALAPSLVSDPGINPGRSAQLQGDIATKLEPGAIGNGAPLTELAQGKLPLRASLAPNEYQELAQKLREAITFAMKAGAENEKEVPPEHAARAQQALVNLLLLQYNLSSNAYLFSADVRSPEDYLLGFNRGNDRGYAVELIRILPVSRLAQYVYHECVPESGIITERDDHRVVYNEIQSAVFGKDEVTALKKDLRDFINRRTATGPVGPRIVVAPRSALVAGKVAIRPGLSPVKSSYMRRWFSAHSYAGRFETINRDSRRTIRTVFGRFEIPQQTELFDLINKAFPDQVHSYGAYGIFLLLQSKYSTDFDQIKNDLEFCINARQNSYVFESLPKMRQNITEADMQKIWLDLASRLASMGIFVKDIIGKGSTIAKTCKTSQELGIAAGLINETSQRLADKGKVAVEKEVRTNYGVAVGRLLTETLIISKRVEDLAINLKYLEIIAARFFQEPERGSRDDSFFATTHADIGKLISEARHFNMQGQGFDVSIKRGRYHYPTDENGNTYETIGVLQEIRIIPGSIKVLPVDIAALPAKAHIATLPSRKDPAEKAIDAGNTTLLGAIGNGIPLAELAQGKLPQRLSLENRQYQEIVRKLQEAIELALKLSVPNQDEISPQHQARARDVLANLMFLENNLSNHLYIFNADIRGPEDYLLGFNFKEYRGLAVEVINGLYEISPKRLAQYIYHECVPEKGDISERSDHRTVYSEIQSAIFGKDEVAALKRDLRSFINERTATGPVRIVSASRGVPIATQAAVKAGFHIIEEYRQYRDGLSSGVLIHGVTDVLWHKKTRELISAINAKALTDQSERLWEEKSRSPSIDVYVREPIRYQYYLYLVKPILSMTRDVAEFRAILSEALKLFDLAHIPITCEFESHSYGEDGEELGIPTLERVSCYAPIFDLTRAIEFINSKLPSKMSIVANDLPVRAKIFAANLTQILAQHPDQLFFMGIETDIGLDQKAQIMPIYKAIDQIKEMRNADGKPLFPNLVVKRGKAADLVTEVASLKEDGKLALNNTFIGARKLSVDNRLYDSIKGEGNAWIAAIDDSRPGDYLPVFESITLSMMAYLNAEVAAIKNFYDAISDKPIDSTALQGMIRNRIIYILPRSTKFEIKQLRDLYELAQQLHTAA